MVTASVWDHWLVRFERIWMWVFEVLLPMYNR